MSLIDVPAGTPLPAALRRMLGPWDRALSMSDGVNASASTYATATATASGTPHVKGGWTELIAATSQEVGALEIYLRASTVVVSADSSTLLDVGIGSAGSEEVVIPDIQVGWRSFSSISPTTALGTFPVHIPRGVRVAVRAQSTVASKTAQVSAIFYPLKLGRVPRKLFVLGVDAASSRGVVLSAPGAANSKGSWTEITSSVPQPLSGLVVCLGGGSDSTVQAGSFLIDIGMGAAGSEQVVVADLSGTATSNEQVVLNQPGGAYDVSVPAGARLAARYASSPSTTGAVDVHLIGVPT